MVEYFGNWRESEYSCKHCNWKGTGGACKEGDLFDALFEICCPKCHVKVGIISYPTIDDVRNNLDKLSDKCKFRMNPTTVPA